MRLRPYTRPSRALYSRRTARALIVMPFSRSRSIESRTWLVIWRASIVWVSSSNRSASVDLPWSMWAMIEKLRRRCWGMVTRRQCSRSDGSARCGGSSLHLECCESGDADHDHDDADRLEPAKAFAEEQEGRDGCECRELTAHHGRDRDA